MNSLLKSLGLLVLLILLQAVLFNRMGLFDLATPFVFLIGLMFLPTSLGFASTMGITFLAGLSLDMISEYPVGLQTSACLWMMSIRRFWISVISLRSEESDIREFNIQDQPFTWVLFYILPLTFVHHLFYFFLRAFTFDDVILTVLRIITSLLYSGIFMSLFYFLLYRKGKNE